MGSLTPYYQDDQITLYCDDCLTVLAQLDEVDHVITDPPYSEHVHANGRTTKTTKRQTDVKEVDFGFDHLGDELRRNLANEFSRLSSRWSLIFTDLEGVHGWIEDINANGRLEYIRTGIWVKANPSPQFTGDRPGSGAEAVVIAHRSELNKPIKKRWNGGGKAAIWGANDKRRHAAETRVHPTQKPTWLLVDMILQFTDPGELVLDPFAGSGSTLLAARETGRRAIGIEMNEKYCELIVNRLQATPLLT